MKYILSEEEYKDLMPRSEHAKVRNGLLDKINRINDFILKDHGFKCVIPEDNNGAYCDACPIGYMKAHSCTREQIYSKDLCRKMESVLRISSSDMKENQ